MQGSKDLAPTFSRLSIYYLSHNLQQPFHVSMRTSALVKVFIIQFSQGQCIIDRLIRSALDFTPR